MPIQFANNAKTMLSSSILAGATTLTVAAATGTKFPAIDGASNPNGDYLVLTLQDAANNIERIKCPHHLSGTDVFGSGSYPLVRGFDGTVARDWAAGDVVALRWGAHEGVEAQRKAGIWCDVVGGTGNAITLTPSPDVTAHEKGLRLRFIATASNTGATTVTVGALAAKAVITANGAALVSSAITSGRLVSIEYDGTSFVLLNPQVLGVMDVNSVAGADGFRVAGWGALRFTGANVLEIGGFNGSQWQRVDLFVNGARAVATDSSQNVAIGRAAGPGRFTAQGAGSQTVMQVMTSAATELFYSGTADRLVNPTENTSAAMLFARADTTTGRSINAGGTINAAGADYAEYERLSPSAGKMAKGDIVGFDDFGAVTDRWADAVSFGIKSTNPSYVGGDTWGSEAAIGRLKPRQPLRPEKDGFDSEAEFDQAIQAWQTDMAAWRTARDLWDADVERVRSGVDRVAYAGKCPVNITGPFQVGDYIIPVKKGQGISGQAVSPSALTFAQYVQAVGRVRRMLPDGRPEVAIIVH